MENEKYIVTAQNQIQELENIYGSSIYVSNPNEILFVGDTIYTDIQLAEECGFHSCLVLSGNTKKDTINMYTIEPDFILEDINKLNDIL